MKKNILSVIGAVTVAAVALKLTTKYVKHEVIKELEDDGCCYDDDDDDCDDCDGCCDCDDDFLDDIRHAPVAAVHVIRVERKHDDAKDDADKKSEEHPSAEEAESDKTDSDNAPADSAPQTPAKEPVEEKAVDEKKSEPEIVVPVKQPAKKEDNKSDLDAHIDEVLDSFSGPKA